MLISLAVDFRRVDLATRERFHLPLERAGQVYEKLRDGPVREAVFVSSCNRSELYGWCDLPATSSRAFGELARAWAPDTRTWKELLAVAIRRREAPSARHLLRVAASLESQLLGDPQILSQLRQAYRRAIEEGSVSAHLHRLFSVALSVGRRVRAETDLIRESHSVGAEGAALAARKLGSLAGRRCVVLGCGATGERAARGLRKNGATNLVVINRHPDRARKLASAVGGRFAPLTALHDEIARADLAIVATSAELPLVDAARLGERRRWTASGDRPLLLVDLSMPRNVAGEVSTLANVTVIDLEGLRAQGQPLEVDRRAAVAEAERIVEQGLSDYREWAHGQRGREAIDPLRAVLSEICRRELAHAADPDEAARIADRIVAKVLAAPISALRAEARRGGDLECVAHQFRRLFAAASAGALRCSSEASAPDGRLA